jgi:hypothetical protein
MSFLSIYHLELHENFIYYSSNFKQFYNRDENKMIVLQGFFHFLKLMNLASSPREIVEMFQTLQLIDGVVLPVEDTLNIKNGMNYAQFLEAILRIAYIKSEEHGAPFKTTLERMFQNANIDIGKRQESDSFLNQIYSEENIEECI